MEKPKSKILFRAVKACCFLVAGAVIALLVVGILVLNKKPDLKVWHTVDLDAEFTVESPVESFADYLALEDKLFAQLDAQVYDKIDPEDQIAVNRYHRGSLSDPSNLARNWNRSFELVPDPPDASKPAVLLLHGLSDSVRSKNLA